MIHFFSYTLPISILRRFLRDGDINLTTPQLRQNSRVVVDKDGTLKVRKR
jgi:hypothetical protein